MTSLACYRTPYHIRSVSDQIRYAADHYASCGWIKHNEAEGVVCRLHLSTHSVLLQREFCRSLCCLPIFTTGSKRHAAFVIYDVQEGSTMRSRCAVNGVATSLRVLREVASTIVDVNGQNSSLTLRCTQGQDDHSFCALLQCYLIGHSCNCCN